MHVCASFYTVSEGSDLMMYVSDNYTSYSAPSRLSKNKLNGSTLLLLSVARPHTVGVSLYMYAYLTNPEAIQASFPGQHKGPFLADTND